MLVNSHRTSDTRSFLLAPSVFAGLFALAAGCADPGVQGKGQSSDASNTGSSNASGETSQSSSSDTNNTDEHKFDAVDILMIIDNSSSMGNLQESLSGTFRRLETRLEKANIDYRIAFITADMNPAECRSNSEYPTIGAKNGQMTAVSCLDREEEFMTVTKDLSRFNTACTQGCNLKGLTTTATKIDSDGDALSRPWVEQRNGQTNLPADVSVAEALSCFGAMGIRGCGLEMHLESMRAALTSSSDPESANYGFLRPNAALAVIIVSDELDCSVNTNVYGPAFRQGSPFYPKIERLQLNHVCLKAGTACSPDLEVGSSESFVECRAVDFDIEGNEITDPAAAANRAILHPVDRYVDFLNDIQNQKTMYGLPEKSVFVSLIGGAEGGGSNDISYRPSDTMEQWITYGISSTCTGQATILDEISPKDGSVVPGTTMDYQSLPPIRMREVISHFAPNPASGGVHSICDRNYDPAVDEIIGAITSGR